MILVRDRRAEQGEDSIAGRLHDVAVVAMDRIDHQLERGIDERARLLGIEVLHQVHRALDIGEQRGERLALAVRYRSVGRFGRDVDAGGGLCGRRTRIDGEGSAALAAEVSSRRIFRRAFRAKFEQRSSAPGAEIVGRGIGGPTLRAVHESYL